MSLKLPDRGPLDTYQIIWRDGTSEEIKAHQVTLHDPVFSYLNHETPSQRRVDFHGEIDGHWKLVLSAPTDEIRTIRRFSPAGLS